MAACQRWENVQAWKQTTKLKVLNVMIQLIGL